MVPDPPSFDVHASAGTAAVEDSRFLREAVNDRLGFAADADGAPVLWAQALVGWGLTGRDGDAGRLDRSTDGVVGGLDVALPDGWRAGVLAGEENTRLRTRLVPTSGTAAGEHLGLYAGGQWGPISVRLGQSYSWRQLELNRWSAVFGQPRRLSSAYGGGLLQGFGELGWVLPTGPAATEPFVGGAYLAQTSDPFIETGGPAPLAGQVQDRELGLFNAGLRETVRFRVQGLAASLTGAVGWRHAFGELTPFATEALPGGPEMTEPGDAVARNAATLEAGLDFVLSRDLKLDVTYNGQIGANLDAVAIRTGLRWRF